MRARLSDVGSVSRTPGLILGVGLGGFLDGIVLHQILHWHNMGSARLLPATMAAVRINMRWDGLFHSGVWLVTLVGVYLLLRDARRGRALPPARSFTGHLLMGWAGFNLVEGVVDHHLLELHHVRDLPIHLPLYDWMFLLIGGLGLMLGGWQLSRRQM